MAGGADGVLLEAMLGPVAGAIAIGGLMDCCSCVVIAGGAGMVAMSVDAVFCGAGAGGTITGAAVSGAEACSTGGAVGASGCGAGARVGACATGGGVGCGCSSVGVGAGACGAA